MMVVVQREQQALIQRPQGLLYLLALMLLWDFHLLAALYLLVQEHWLQELIVKAFQVLL